MATKIAVRGLSRTFRLSRGKSVEALRRVDLDVEEGEFVCLIGASGCGKTTLLRIIGDFEGASEGYVEIVRGGAADRPLTATVFQEDSVFPWLTAQQNVEYGLRIRGLPVAERRRIAGRFIDKVGLSAFRHAWPHQLSGGMRQRVSVARAFAAGPEVLLMDEPFGALDEQTRLVLQGELLRLWGEDRRTVIFVTHSLDEAIALADRIVVMSPRPGQIRKILPVEIPRPRQAGDLRAHPAYGPLYRELWSLIRGDVDVAA